MSHTNTQAVAAGGEASSWFYPRGPKAAQQAVNDWRNNDFLHGIKSVMQFQGIDKGLIQRGGEFFDKREYGKMITDADALVNDVNKPLTLNEQRYMMMLNQESARTAWAQSQLQQPTTPMDSLVPNATDQSKRDVMNSLFLEDQLSNSINRGQQNALAAQVALQYVIQPPGAPQIPQRVQQNQVQQAQQIIQNNFARGRFGGGV